MMVQLLLASVRLKLIPTWGGGAMARTVIKVRTVKPADKPLKLTDGEGMHLLVNPNG